MSSSVYEIAGLGNLMSELKGDKAKRDSLVAMIDDAFVGSMPDKEFIIQNADAYSALNSTAVLGVVGKAISQETAHKAVNIVTILRQSGIDGVRQQLLDVLGSVSRSSKGDKSLIEAWEKAAANVPEADISDCNLETDDGLAEAIKRCLKRNEEIYARMEEAKKKSVDEDTHKEVTAKLSTSKEDELRKKVLIKRAEETVSNIMDTLEQLYKDLFVNPAMGILTPEGILGVVGDSDSGYVVGNVEEEDLPFQKAVFALIMNCLGDSVLRLPNIDGSGEVYSAMPVDIKGNVLPDLYTPGIGACTYNYFPKLQAHLSKGIRVDKGKYVRIKKASEFFDRMREALINEVTCIFKAVFADSDVTSHDVIKEITALQRSIISIYTTTFVAEEVRYGKAVRIRMHCIDARDNPIENVAVLKSIGDKLKMDTSIIAKASECETLYNEESPRSSGIVKLTLALNKQKFVGETLFAYEALQRLYDAGGSPDMAQVVLGRKLNGDLMTLDFSGADKTVVSIQGAGRSGKGVLTMTILANVLGCGLPFIYLDCKPDMAALLWMLEGIYKEKNGDLRILSIDVMNGAAQKTILQANGGQAVVKPPRRNDAYNKPKWKGVSCNWNSFAYMKLLGLYGFAMSQKGKDRISELEKVSLMYAIADEGNKASTEVTKAVISLRNRRSALNKDSTKDGRAANSEEIEGITKIIDFCDSAREYLLSVGTAFPMSGLKVLVLGQKDTQKDWGGGGEQQGTYLYGLLTGATCRILGTENVSSTPYQLGEAKAQGISYVSGLTPGHFAFLPVGQAEDDNVVAEVFKSYLVLNANDYPGSESKESFTGEMLRRIKGPANADTRAKLSMEYNGVTPNPLVGVHGLLEYIAEKAQINVAEKLGMGYTIMEDVAASIGIVGEGGIYTNIEDWLFDCDPDSFWSPTSMNEAIQDGVKLTKGSSAPREGTGGLAFNVLDTGVEVVEDDIFAPIQTIPPINVQQDITQDSQTEELVEVAHEVPQEVPQEVHTEQDLFDENHIGIAEVAEIAGVQGDAQESVRHFTQEQPAQSIDDYMQQTPPPVQVQPDLVDQISSAVETQAQQDTQTPPASQNFQAPAVSQGFQTPVAQQGFQPPANTQTGSIPTDFNAVQDELLSINERLNKLGFKVVPIGGGQLAYDANNNPYNVEGPGSVPVAEPGIFEGTRMTSHPAVDSYESPMNRSANQIPELNNASYMQYAAPADDYEISRSRWRWPRISSVMGVKDVDNEFRRCWDTVLRAIARDLGGAHAVTRVEIGENSLAANGKQYSISKLVPPGVLVSELADFADLFETFRSLKTLVLDYPAYLAFSNSYSQPYIPFTKSKVLQLLRVTYRDGRTIDYTREIAAQKLQMPQDRLTSTFNSFSAMAAQVNKGSDSAFCKPGHKLRTATWTKRMAAGAFGPDSTWSKPRRAAGFIGMVLGAAATVVTGGIQVARASTNKRAVE